MGSNTTFFNGKECHLIDYKFSCSGWFNYSMIQLINKQIYGLAILFEKFTICKNHSTWFAWYTLWKHNDPPQNIIKGFFIEINVYFILYSIKSIAFNRKNV